MSTNSSYRDLLRLLREDPDFRDEVRQLVLSQELLELPERFARFEVYVEKQFAEVRADISRLDEGQAQMRQDTSEMRGNIAKNTSDIGALRGAQYERKVSRSFTSYASRAFRLCNDRRLHRNRLLLSTNRDPADDFEDILAAAVEDGRITDDELDELREADAVMMGLDQDSTVYFVGEFSVTVNNHDLDRAIARAKILGRATGSNAWPMVIGAIIPEPQRARAEAEGVALRQVSE